jgi:hypothetical protein
MYKVSNVVSVHVPGEVGSGFGFNITTTHGAPMVDLTQDEAKEAAQHILSAMRNAIFLISHP